MVQFSSNDKHAESVAPNRSPHRSDQRGCATGGGRVFTRASANRVLPLVKRITSDLLGIWRDLETHAAQIDGINSLPNTSDIRVFTDELDCIKAAFRAQSERLDAFQQELADLGVVVDSLADGAFDFPAYSQCRPIRFCWQIGEPEVMHWHGVGESFRDRRPLDECQIEG